MLVEAQDVMTARLLMTRPYADSVAFAKSVGASNAVISPLMEMRLGGALPQLNRGLIFSSAKGVAAYVALDGPAALPTWCIGARTAQAAADAGLLVQGTVPNSDQLVRAPLGNGAWTHLHGRHTRGDVAARLTARGIPCTSGAIYDQVAQPLSSDAIALLISGKRIILPLFSPRSAVLFGQQCPMGAWGNLMVPAMSQAVADALPTGCSYVVAATPDGAGMQTLVRNVMAKAG